MDPNVRPIRPLLTLNTPLRDIPTEWLQVIEPGLIRGAFLPCWVMPKSINTRSGLIHIKTPEGEYTTAIRYIAKMFWEFPANYRVAPLCDTIGCCNPAHLHVGRANTVSEVRKLFKY